MQFNDQRINGPDLSFYQTLRDEHGNIIAHVDFDKMKSYGVHYAIFKAGQRNYIDPDFKYNWGEAKRVGLARAAYWFLDYRASGTAQAELFWALLKDDPGEGPLIVDFEMGSGFWKNHLEDFIVRLQVLSGYAPDRIWIYTGYYYWKDLGPQTAAEVLWFLAYGLWLAAYANRPDNVLVPAPWPTAHMWQRGTTIVWGPDLGVHSLELDWNTFNGDITEWKKYWITDNLPTPPEGGNMKYKVMWSGGVARRTAPHTGTSSQNTYTGKVYLNQEEVEVIEDNIPDANDPANANKIWVKFADNLFGAAEYPNSSGVPSVRMVQIEEPIPDPVPVPTPCVSKPFVLKVEGYKEVSGTLGCE